MESVDQAKAAQKTAAALGLPVRAIELRNPPYDYERALAEVGETPGDALMVMTSPIFFGDRDRLGAFALHHRLPSIFGFREWADAGGLMSYGAIRDSMIRLAAHYVDKILKGANSPLLKSRSDQAGSAATATTRMANPSGDAAKF